MAPDLIENMWVGQTRCSTVKVHTLPNGEDELDHAVVEVEPRVLGGEGDINLGSAHEDVGGIVYRWSFELEETCEGVGI